MAPSDPQVQRAEDSAVRQRCDALTALRMLVEAVCDDVVEITPESDVLGRMHVQIVRLRELVDGQAAGAVNGRLVEVSKIAS